MKRLLLLVSCVLVANLAHAQQVVFSRRVYAAVGQTYQQLWTLDIASGKLAQLTTSARDHEAPQCASDSGSIFFAAGDPFWAGTRIWMFDAHARVERQLAGDSTWNDPRLLGVGSDGRLIVEHCLEPRTAFLAPCARVTERYTVSGGRVTASEQVVSPEHASISLAAGGGHCDEALASRDGQRTACYVNMDLIVASASTHDVVVRVPFDGRYSNGDPYPNPPTPLAWSPDGTRILVGLYGEYSGSTAYVWDYFILDIRTKTWRRVMSGNDALWLPDGGTILYTTQRDLAPLPPPASAHSVWTQHLAAFDVASGNVTMLTSGVKNDMSPALCKP